MRRGHRGGVVGMGMRGCWMELGFVRRDDADEGNRTRGNLFGWSLECLD